MRGARSRFAFLSIFVTTLLSLGVGGFATFQSSQSDLQAIDTQLLAVEANVQAHSDEPTSSALYIIESEKFDISLTLRASDGLLTPVIDSHLREFTIPPLEIIEKAKSTPLTVQGLVPYRFKAIETPSGDLLLLGASLRDVEFNLKRNLNNLILFTLLADAVAIFLSIFLLRRHNRGLDQSALMRMQEFLADASHELRTPLTVIKGYTEMLSKEQLTQAADKERAFFRVNSEIKRMESLIHDLLLLAELGEKRQIERQVVDLSDLTRNLAQDFQTLHPQRNVEIKIDESPDILCARDHIHRLIQNILTNIEKHTPESAPVRVSLVAKSKSIVLTIEDGGPGLPDSAYKGEIKTMARFDPSRSRESGGSGLGLSIIAAIVQEHNGKLSLSKSDLGGLKIQAEIPN